MPPEGLAKEAPKIMKLNECLDILDCTMVLNLPTGNLDATNTTDSLKHIPDLF